MVYIRKNIFHIMLNYCTNFSGVIVLIVGVFNLVEIMDKDFTHRLFVVVVFFQLAKQKILNEYLLVGPTQRNGETK